LPSRLFRNIGLPPPLRSLITPYSSPFSISSVQLRLRLGLLAARNINNTPRLGSACYSTESTGVSTGLNSSTSKDRSGGSSESAVSLSSSQNISFELPTPRLQMTFTCTVENCGTRSTHQFTKHAYEKGIVLIQCPGCHNRHLIADHLGWFKESTEEGRLRTVEDLLRARGESVTRGRLDAGGVVEYSE